MGVFIIIIHITYKKRFKTHLLAKDFNKIKSKEAFNLLLYYITCLL